MQKSCRRLVVRLREDRAIGRSKILVEGKTVHNPIPQHPDVCPFDCKKSPDVQVSHFLTRHHADKSIGLFSCQGCPHLLFKASIVPTDSLPLHSAEIITSLPTDPKATSIEFIEGAVKVETKIARILDRGTSKRITLPKRWIPTIDTQNVNMHLIRGTVTERSYILVEFSALDSLEEEKVSEPQSTNQTSMSDDYVTLTRNTYNRLEGRGIDLTCALCDNPIRVGEQYHANKSRKKRYHKECWESLFVEGRRIT